MKQSTRKKPVMTERLLAIACKILKEKGKVPDILDYGGNEGRTTSGGRWLCADRRAIWICGLYTVDDYAFGMLLNGYPTVVMEVPKAIIIKNSSKNEGS